MWVAAERLRRVVRMKVSSRLNMPSMSMSMSMSRMNMTSTARAQEES